MYSKVLTGIERELVLKYLVDGNVPVTITPEEESENKDEIHVPASRVYSVRIDPENISVLKEGIILLQDVPESVADFKGKEVRVEFYFNRLGLYFITTVKSVSTGPAIVIPKSIYRIEDVEAEQKYDFSALLYFSVIKNDSGFYCVPFKEKELFCRPMWSFIPLEQQKKAKAYLEELVPQARRNGNGGNGLHLISVCRYFVAADEPKVDAVQGRVKPFSILFINHERIVLGFEKNVALPIKEGNEYAMSMSFVMKDAPAISREVFVTCRVSCIYESKESDALAADCIFTSLKEEDCRFLYEKATSSLFN